MLVPVHRDVRRLGVAAPAASACRTTNHLAADDRDRRRSVTVPLRANRGKLRFGSFRSSGTSDAHSVNGSGCPTVADSVCANPSGGPVSAGPSGANLITGGSLLLAACLKKLTQYGGFSQNDTVDVWPLTVSVQVSRLVAEILRHLDREDAVLPARLEVRGLAVVGTAGLDAIVRTDRNVERPALLRL